MKKYQTGSASRRPFRRCCLQLVVRRRGYTQLRLAELKKDETESTRDLIWAMFSQDGYLFFRYL